MTINSKDKGARGERQLANKLKEYVEAHQGIPNSKELKDHLKVIEIIREELETSLKRLSTPSGNEV